MTWVSTSRGHRKAFQVVTKVRIATALIAGNYDARVAVASSEPSEIGAEPSG
jgi:hypothetical protein